MTGSEAERRRPELAPRPVRVLRPYDPIPLTVCPHLSAIQCDEVVAITELAPLTRNRHLREFEGGESAF